MRGVLLGSTWALVAWFAGCAAPPPTVVTPGDGLQRARYVLPPEPPPPRPLSEAERRALEAEWPAPTTRDPFPEHTIISTWDVASRDCAPGWSRPRTCSAPRGGRWSRPHRQPPTGVLVRVVPSRCSSAPAIVLEVR